MKKILALALSFFLAVPLSFGATLEVDWFEYANDTTAQAAYVTNGGTTAYGSNILSGGTPSDDDTHASTDYQPPKAVDGNTETRWSTAGVTDYPHFWKYDFGSGVTKTIAKWRINPFTADGVNVSGFTIGGSNDNSSWTTLYTRSDGAGAISSGWNDFTFSNTTGYRYYKITVTSAANQPAKTCSCFEFEAMEGGNPETLQSYSEGTIKTQGSYSLKGSSTTGALNKTLTRTLSATQNLTGVKNLKFDIRSSRTGSNIKIGIHDSGGTTTEITPNIISANTFQTVNWSLAAVSDANKDAIDSIIITIVNADSANTFYLDNMGIAQAIDVFGMVS